MKAIILCAGIGSRIRPLTDNKPKFLLSVGNKILGEIIIKQLLSFQINQFIFVTGYFAEKVEHWIQNTFPNLNATFIRNPLFENTNTGYSLLLTKDAVAKDSFIKIDGDVIVEDEIIKNIIHSKHENCLTIDTNIHLEKEEVKVILDENSNIKAVGKKLDPLLSTGESIGIEKLSLKGGFALFSELEKVMQEKTNYQEYYDDSYTTLVQKGISFGVVNITGKKWVEIDTHEDYQRAIQYFGI